MVPFAPAGRLRTPPNLSGSLLCANVAPADGALNITDRRHFFSVVLTANPARLKASQSSRFAPADGRLLRPAGSATRSLPPRRCGGALCPAPEASPLEAGARFPVGLAGRRSCAGFLRNGLHQFGSILLRSGLVNPSRFDARPACAKQRATLHAGRIPAAVRPPATPGAIAAAESSGIFRRVWRIASRCALVSEAVNQVVQLHHQPRQRAYASVKQRRLDRSRSPSSSSGAAVVASAASNSDCRSPSLLRRACATGVPARCRSSANSSAKTSAVVPRKSLHRCLAG